MPWLQVNGIEDAVLWLQRSVHKYNDCSSIDMSEQLCLDVTIDRQNVHNDDRWWGRFVTLLQQCSNVMTLDWIKVSDALLDRPGDEDFERLFRDVLPTQKSWNKIEFHGCKILPAYLDLLATSLLLSNNNHNNHNTLVLRTLEFFDTDIDSTSADAIARLLYAKNGPPIQSLCLSGCSIDSTSCNVILKALDGNSRLEELNLGNNKILEISLEAARALGNCKNLDYIRLDKNPLSDESLCHLAEGLRTTCSLKVMCVSGVAAGANFNLALDAFAELFKTFNYHLAVYCNFGPTMMEQERRDLLHDSQQISPTRRKQLRQLYHNNQKIITLHRGLLLREYTAAAAAAAAATTTTTTSSSYHLPQVSLWPLTLECIGSKPSLIYRFVRHGNLESFTDQVFRASSISSNKLRRVAQWDL